MNKTKLEMVGSDSESECFESAEESLDEEEKKEGKPRIKKSSRDSESEVAEPVVSQNDKVDETILPEEVSVNSLSYRKRPERVKRTHSIPSPKVIPRNKTCNETILKSDVADVFFQDITSNLSKNFNKSFHTLQQTSSNVKDLILSSLPTSSPCVEEGFMYDDSLNISSPPIDNIFLNETFDDKTVFTNDFSSNLSKCASVRNNEMENIPNIQNSESDKCDLQEESLKINPDYNVTDKSTAQISDSDKGPLNTPEIDQKVMNLENLNNCYLHDQVSTLKLTDTEECKDNPHQSSINISAQHNLNIDESVFEELKINEDVESSLSSDIVPQSIMSEIDNKDITSSLQIHHYRDNMVGQECYSDSTNKEADLNIGCKNTYLEQEEDKTKECVMVGLDKEEVVEENNQRTNSREVGFNKVQEQKSLNNCEINTVNIKSDKENIIKQKEVKIADETLKDTALEEVYVHLKECSGKSNEISDGWDDFDFSDNEIESIDIDDVNKCAKLDESKDAGDMEVNKKILNKPYDSHANKTNENSEAEAVSLGCPNEDNVIDGNKKEKKSLEKNDSEEAWDWENWNDETVEAEGKEMESAHKATVTNNDETENLPDDGSIWSGWDTFSQKIEEKQGNWNIGTWGVNLLLNKATAVTQGISNVLEAGLGAPDPETLARMQKLEENQLKLEIDKIKTDEQPEEISKKNSLSGVNLFPVSGITNLVAGVTSKIVEHTKLQEIGSKVLTGGLDTLETFGKKTMEVLQDGDPGLRNKRALLIGNNKPILSQILREAREKADEEVKQVEEKALAKKCHFETLFDDFQGMVHLEALEMLSRQYELKLEQVKSGMSPEELEDLEGILEEVEQLCTLDDLDINSSVLDFKTQLQMAVESLKEEISTVKIIQIYDNVNKWLHTSFELDPSLTTLHQKAVSTVAELTAATVHEFHKAGELLSIKECRKTVDEIDALAKLTSILCMQISKVCENFILMIQNKSKNELDLQNTITQKISVMRNNSTSYIKQAFNLLIPVLQAGAAL